MDHLTFEILLDFLQFKYLFYVALGTISGIVVGVVPGLTVTMATAILVSFTYGWPVYDALALMMGIYVGGVYGGGQTAILVNIPGAPAAIATTLDGFPLAQRGEGGPAIALLTTQSFLGGIIGILFLGFTAPAITSFALKFTSPEYFLLGLFGVTMMGRMGSESLVIGLLSGLFGVWLSMIGIDPIYGVVDRYTFGLVDLSGGVPIIPALIGMFGLSEVLFQLKQAQIKPVVLKVKNILPKFWQIVRYYPLTIWSSIIGVLIGALPGVGGHIASIIAYDSAKRFVRKPSRPFGQGAYEGIVAPESANNAAIGGALIPALTLAIPGDQVTVIMLAAFMLHGLRPGPLLMVHSPEYFWGIVVWSLLANIFMLVFGLIFVRVIMRVVTIPKTILMPIIVVLCVVGSYADSGNLFNVYEMFALGVAAWLMRSVGFSVAAAVLGFILGPIIDENLRRAIILADTGSDVPGFLLYLMGRPICVVLTMAIAAMILAEIPWIRAVTRKGFGTLLRAFR